MKFFFPYKSRQHKSQTYMNLGLDALYVIALTKEKEEERIKVN